MRLGLELPSGELEATVQRMEAAPAADPQAARAAMSVVRETTLFLSSQVKFISQNYPASQNSCISGPIRTRRLETSCRRADPRNEGRGLGALKYRQARNIWTKDKVYECLLGLTLVPKTHIYKDKSTAISRLCDCRG